MNLQLRRCDDDLFPAEEGELSTRLWLSDQQWLNLLEQARRAEPESIRFQDAADDRRDEPRTEIDFRCILRWGGELQDAGVYAVQARNVSPNGLAFLHTQPIPDHTHCTLALQPPGLPGMITSGRSIWSRILESGFGHDVYEVGLRFDQAIDLDPFHQVA
ncbi:MAG: PilZ domain-containing protein [Planctomycetota bacterium]